VIAVQSPVEFSHFVAIGENLSFAHCPNDSLAGVLLSHLPQVLSEHRCLMIEAARRFAILECYIGAPYTRYLRTALQSTTCWAQQTTDRYAKMRS
jgi:hypothetical protein